MNYGPLPMLQKSFSTIFGPIGGPAIVNPVPPPVPPETGLSQQSYWAPTGNTFLRAVPNLDDGDQDAAAVTAVPTFHSVGFTWPTTAGGDAVTCQCIYRRAGSSTWIEAHPLWWDGRAGEEEYRGSILFLMDGADYEARLKLSTGEFATVTWSTWPEHPPEGTVTEVADRSETLTLSGGADSGTVGAWKVWTFPSGETSATIGVADGADYCIDFDAVSYVIVRGLMLRDPSILCGRLRGGSNHIIIENGAATGWGRPPTADFNPGVDGEVFGENKDAAIGNIHGGAGGGKDTDCEAITIRRMDIHSPRFDTNAWDQPEKTHPKGPAAINLSDSAGNHVIAYNHIRSGNGNKYNDVLIGERNTSDAGFPGPNSDIYHNILRDCWDDCTELEGSGENVRAWANYTDGVFSAVATTICHSGPLYILRNVCDQMRRNAAGYESGNERWSKSQGVSGAFGGGRIYQYNNITLQSGGLTRGAAKGIMDNGSADSVNNMVTRMNWWWLAAGGKAIDALPDVGNNDFDFDFTTGTYSIGSGEANGATGVTPVFLNGVPAHSPDAPSGDYELDPTSRGYEEGEEIPNITAHMTSATPDVGAHEKGTLPIQYGTEAFL